MGNTCSTHRRNAYKILVKIPKGKRPQERSRNKWERVTLKWILKKQGVTRWTEFIWLMIETSGRLL
jgi:hypothetical protein